MGKNRTALQTHTFRATILTAKINGTKATPDAEGFDDSKVKEIIDLGAGNYTVVFNKSYERDIAPLGLVTYTADTRGEVTAVAEDRVTVQMTDLAGVATDADFQLTVMTSDLRFVMG